MAVSGQLAERDPCAAGEAALARGAWGEARQHFEAALAGDESAQALEGLSWAAWWQSDAGEMFASRERAYRAYRRAGDVCGAARMAVWLATDSLDFRGDDAVAKGWLERARRLLEDRSQCSEYGWLLIFDGYHGLRAGADAERAVRLGREAAELGEELEVVDLEAVGLALEGDALVTAGAVVEGMLRLDQAAALASGEEFELPISPIFAQCIMIGACEKVGDFGRVMQWCESMRAIGERLNGPFAIGACRSSYGNVLTARGEWSEAELELTGALGALEATRPGLAVAGLLRLAQLRARQGRRDEARELFERSLPEPLAHVGLGMLALEAGDGLAAAESAERSLRRAGSDALVDRVPALELLVRARAGQGDLEAAGSVFEELDRIVAGLGTPYLTARARLVSGELALAAGEVEEGRRTLEDAVDLFAESAAPYEAAVARLTLATALARLGRGEAAAAEALAAQEAFVALGATADAQRAEAAIAAAAAGERAGEDGAAPLGELTPREQEVLRLVAQGMSDAEIAERLVVSPHTVHRHVANVRTKLRLPSRAAAVAYASREGLI